MDINDRESLIREKTKADEEIRKLKADIRTATTKARKHGQHVNPTDYNKMQATLARLQKRSQRIQALLAGTPKQKHLDFGSVFVDVAKEQLSDATFEQIRQIAMSRLKASVAARQAISDNDN